MGFDLAYWLNECTYGKYSVDELLFILDELTVAEEFLENVLANLENYTEESIEFIKNDIEVYYEKLEELKIGYREETGRRDWDEQVARLTKG